jgi:hypothetical protein
MKRCIPIFGLILLLFGCGKDEVTPDDNTGNEDNLRSSVFNGQSKWRITKMESSTPRVGAVGTNWLSMLPACRQDNIYEFGELGIDVVIFAIDESEKVCSDQETNYVNSAMFINFSSDFKTAEVDMVGRAMLKMYDVEPVENIHLQHFDHTWSFKEISEKKVVVNANIIPNESAGMVEQTANVEIVFERIN